MIYKRQIDVLELIEISAIMATKKQGRRNIAEEGEVKCPSRGVRLSPKITAYQELRKPSRSIPGKHRKYIDTHIKHKF